MHGKRMFAIAALPLLVACNKGSPDTASPADGADGARGADGQGVEGEGARDMRFSAAHEEGSTIKSNESAIDREIKTEGSLGPDEVADVVNQHMKDISACYQATMERMRTDDLEGIVAIEFTITTTGKVKDATKKEADVGDDEMHTCIANAVGKWSFPKPPDKGEVKVVFPFELKPY